MRLGKTHFTEYASLSEDMRSSRLEIPAGQTRQELEDTQAHTSTKRVSRCWSAGKMELSPSIFRWQALGIRLEVSALWNAEKLDGRDVSLLIGGPEIVMPAC